MHDVVHSTRIHDRTWLYGARCAFGPRKATHATIEINDGRITRIRDHAGIPSTDRSMAAEIDLGGFLLMPGLINSHDHLQFALFPRLGHPPYGNYIEWGEDIHKTFGTAIEKQLAISRTTRLWWGSIRNLLCGATTVCHHDPLWPELQRHDFSVSVVQRYGWVHSLAFGDDVRAAHDATPAGCPFILHACEGVDDLAKREIVELKRLGVLDAHAVLVHGLALDEAGVALMRKRGTSLILCPSSNEYLYGRLPDMSVIGHIGRIALGNDSPLTAIGDLLDEIRFASLNCGIQAEAAYRMVTTGASEVLRLSGQKGTIAANGPGDLVAVRDTGLDPADRLLTTSMMDVELVMVNGQVQVASDSIWERLPIEARHGMESLWIGGCYRYLRAPVAMLLQQAEEVLGRGEVRLGGRAIRVPAYA